jgi:hypothetical protein
LEPAAEAQRQQNREDRYGRHQREHKPQRHQAGSGGVFWGNGNAPLYTTAAKPGN